MIDTSWSISDLSRISWRVAGGIWFMPAFANLHGPYGPVGSPIRGVRFQQARSFAHRENFQLILIRPPASQRTPGGMRSCGRSRIPVLSYCRPTMRGRCSNSTTPTMQPMDAITSELARNSSPHDRGRDSLCGHFAGVAVFGLLK